MGQIWNIRYLSWWLICYRNIIHGFTYTWFDVTRSLFRARPLACFTTVSRRRIITQSISCFYPITARGTAARPITVVAPFAVDWNNFKKNVRIKKILIVSFSLQTLFDVIHLYLDRHGLLKLWLNDPFYIMQVISEWCILVSECMLAT